MRPTVWDTQVTHKSILFSNSKLIYTNPHWAILACRTLLATASKEQNNCKDCRQHDQVACIGLRSVDICYKLYFTQQRHVTQKSSCEVIICVFIVTGMAYLCNHIMKSPMRSLYSMTKMNVAISICSLQIASLAPQRLRTISNFDSWKTICIETMQL